MSKIVGWISSEPYRHEAPEEMKKCGEVDEDQLKWRVRLDCGHLVAAYTGLDFDPSIGPQRTIAPEDIPACRARLQRFAHRFPPEEFAEILRAIDKGGLVPDPEMGCWRCARPNSPS